MDPQMVVIPGIFDLSGTHILIILFVALLLFGHKLPEVMRNLGGSMREFKKGMSTEDPPKPAAPPATVPSAPVPPATSETSVQREAATPPSPK